MLFEEAGEMNKAANAFNMALQFLNNEAKASRAGARAPMQVEIWGYGVGGIPSTI